MNDLTLANWALILGGLIVAVNAAFLAAPERFKRWALAFPRSQTWAWVLTALDLLWAAWIVLRAPLGRFEHLKPAIYVAMPVAFFLVVFFMDELLAPRAAGGLLLLLANPILNAARWHPSPWRLVVTVLCYVWVIAGMVFVLSPYRFRYMVEWATKTPERMRLLGVARLLFGLALLLLGWRVY
jgi:uncharacterized protein YjeT (DUF2065 family)